MAKFLRCSHKRKKLLLQSLDSMLIFLEENPNVGEIAILLFEQHSVASIIAKKLPISLEPAILTLIFTNIISIQLGVEVALTDRKTGEALSLLLQARGHRSAEDQTGSPCNACICTAIPGGRPSFASL